jgi:putative hydrolase of the HAD superfamily
MASVVVFDMGGVLYEFQGDRLIAEASRRKRRWRSEEVQRLWVPLVRGFETGRAREHEFAEEVVRAYDLSLSGTEFLQAFRAAARGYYAGALSLVQAVARRHRVVSLSNTNPVQWPEVLMGLGEADPFHAHYPSHVSGFHKPDPRAFELVERAHGAAERYHFLDDRADNVAAASARGWHARRVRGIEEARRACLELGLLGAPLEHARDE